jgi:hypothetical protein
MGSSGMGSGICQDSFRHGFGKNAQDAFFIGRCTNDTGAL